MTCVPTLNPLLFSVAPKPSVPLMLLVHVRELPDRAPSSGSLPVPTNGMDAAVEYDALLAGELIDTDGAWLAAVMVMLRVAVADAPLESVARRVIVCTPMESNDVLTDVPAPSCPLILLVQTREAPLSAPSSGSDPEPVNRIV